MDLFNKKRTAELTAEIARLQIRDSVYAKELRAAHNQVEYLVRTIRDMDKEIWNMSQKTNWLAQRPHFVKLNEAMIARKVAESTRIADILRPAMIETYGGEAGPKQIGKSK